MVDWRDLQIVMLLLLLMTGVTGYGFYASGIFDGTVQRLTGQKVIHQEGLHVYGAASTRSRVNPVSVVKQPTESIFSSPSL